MFRKRLLSVIGLIATFFVIGCADEQARAGLADTNARLMQLQETVGVLNTKVTTQKLVDLLNKLDNLQSQIDSLNGNVDTLKQDQQSYKATQDELYQSLEQQIQILQQGGVKTLPSAKTSSSATSVAAKPQGDDSADSGDSSLKLALKQVKSHKFTEAIQNLKHIMVTSTNQDVVASATYYLAVAYAANQQYKSAISVAQKFVIDNPDSQNAPDAMRIIYISQIQSGMKKAANKTAQTLISKYPNSDAAKKIQDH